MFVGGRGRVQGGGWRPRARVRSSSCGPPLHHATLLAVPPPHAPPPPPAADTTPQDRIPIISDFIKLVGIGVTGWFTWRYLVFGPDREELVRNIKSFLKKVYGA